MIDLPMFYVVGMPRSGTTWLASTFAIMNPEWMITHEAHNEDFHMDHVAAFHPWEADEYVSGAREDRLIDYIKRKKPGATGYGEVTPRLRYFSEAVRRHYPEAKFVHLVRDPKLSIVSMMNFGYCATGRGRLHRRIAPDGEVWSQRKRAAWAWAYGHHRIRQTIKKFVRFEDLLADFEEVARLAEYLGIECDRDVWERRRVKKVNPSNPTHPLWHQWPTSWQREMHVMCGAEARQYGYLAD